MVCNNCGNMLPEGQGDYATCAIEGMCLACCSDFVGHCSDVRQYEAEADAWLKAALAEAEVEVARVG